jgi:hypothetical protein
MRQTRILAAAAMLVASLVLPTASSAASAATFHGTFSSGAVYSAAAGDDPILTLPLGGVWNVNVNLAGESPRATAQFVVKLVPQDVEFGFPAHGLHALWTPSFLELKPLTTASPTVARVIADAAGVVYDRDNGIYAFTADLPGVTAIAVINTNTGRFFYAGVATPAMCPAAGGDPYCFDSVQVSGTMGH